VAGFDIIQKADDVNNREWSAASPLAAGVIIARPIHSPHLGSRALVALTNSFFLHAAFISFAGFSKCGKSNGERLCCASSKKWYSWQKRAKELWKEKEMAVCYAEKLPEKLWGRARPPDNARRLLPPQSALLPPHSSSVLAALLFKVFGPWIFCERKKRWSVLWSLLKNNKFVFYANFSFLKVDFNFSLITWHSF
jgi:hypothetical protein